MLSVNCSLTAELNKNERCFIPAKTNIIKYSTKQIECCLGFTRLGKPFKIKREVQYSILTSNR